VPSWIDAAPVCAARINQWVGVAARRAHLGPNPGRLLISAGRMRRSALTSCTGLLLVSTFLAAAPSASAQDIEPRAYSNAPIGVNFLVAGYSFTRGGLSFDPAIPVSNPQLRTSSAGTGYAHVFDFWGESAKIEASIPYTWLSGTAEFAGRPVERVVNGFGDARVRLSVNLYGAPALTLKEFQDYEQDLIVGASLAVTAPTGQYDPSRLVNLGTNRWSIRPEIGVSKALGSLTLELAGGPTIYTDNTNFLNGRTRSQNPIYSFQGHAIYSFGSGIWASVDATYFTGGTTSVDDVTSNSLQRNWRLGATLSFSLSPRYSIKLYGSSGVSARTHDNYDLVGIALQYRWGAGL
jgi:hypothetical protein